MKEENKKKNTTKKASSNTTKKKANTSATKKSASTKSTMVKKGTPKKNNVVKETVKKVETENVVKSEKVKEQPVIPLEKFEEKSTFTKNEEQVIFVLRVITIVLAAILVVVASIKIFMEARDSNYSWRWENKSYLVEKNLAKQISCDEISNVIKGDSKFVFVTYFGNKDMSEEEKKIMEEEFELEKDLAKMIKDNHLEQDFYVYPLIDNCRPTALKNLQVSNLDGAPIILYYRNGKLEYTVKREDELMISDADFAKLLDIYEITK